MVASVAMNGGKPKRLMRNAWNKPIPRPIRRVIAIAATTTTAEGSPVLSPRSHSVINLAAITDENATTAPTDRSIPPEMMTTAAPMARTP